MRSPVRLKSASAGYERLIIWPKRWATLTLIRYRHIHMHFFEYKEALLGQVQWIKDKRESDWHWITILEGLPIKVSSSSFYRFIKRHNLNQDQITPLEYFYGEIVSNLGHYSKL